MTIQAVLHWGRANCAAQSSRAAQHELLSGATTGLAALLYLAMACGISQDYEKGSGVGSTQRLFFHLAYVGRAFVPCFLLLNISTLARERRSPAAALLGAWITQVLALYLGQLVQAQKRWIFLLAAVAALLPMGITMCASMGGRLHQSPLMTAYHFLVTWVCLCGAGFCWLFLCCQVFHFLDVQTEVVLGAILDYCLLGVSSIAISCAGPDIQAPLLPSQEEELSLYPGPHSHGFFPNLDFYDDNL
ncbi:unnamed protein product [Symbiodinium natans]|uniref:Uncharacterized protein n=1 Tax=Symbiodinium natans TaxID=878477 RepID=A0A812K1U4_9DINO|nr:unnamed protein product [Symbiodinium natans]